MKKLVLGALAGTGIAYMFKRWRGDGADEWVSTGVDSGTSAARNAASAADNKPTADDQPDDALLARKVESEIFRTDDVPKGQINVNAELGVVYLRGEVPEQSMIDDLVGRAHGVDGVDRVESLLHLPGQEAPMHQS